MTVAESMKQAVRRLQRGMCTIAECEAELNCIIKRETIGMYDLDEIIEAERKLKRKAWRMLLEATRREG